MMMLARVTSSLLPKKLAIVAPVAHLSFELGEQQRQFQQVYLFLLINSFFKRINVK
jgi:hypothetical protein